MKESQCDKILSYMRRCGSITQDEASAHIGCKRLAARIADLKKRGYAIRSEIVTGKNRDQETVTYARYSLI